MKAEALSKHLRVMPTVYIANIEKNSFEKMLVRMGEDSYKSLKYLIGVFDKVELGMFQIVGDENGGIEEDKAVKSVAMRMAAKRCRDGLITDINSSKGEVSDQVVSNLRRWYNVWDVSNTNAGKDKNLIKIDLNSAELVIADEKGDTWFKINTAIPVA